MLDQHPPATTGSVERVPPLTPDPSVRVAGPAEVFGGCYVSTVYGLFVVFEVLVTPARVMYVGLRREFCLFSRAQGNNGYGISMLG